MYNSLARFFALFYISAGFILSADCSSIRQPSRPHENSNLLDSDSEPDYQTNGINDIEPTMNIEFSPRINNGEEVPPAQFTFMAEVGYEDQNDRKIRYACGGTLISDYHVLTAAHCIIHEIHYVVRVGSVDNKNPQIDTQEIHVRRIIVHPDYSKYTGNDIGLLLLVSRVYSSLNVRPLDLQTLYDLESIKSDVETSYVAIGFGLTGHGGDQSDKLLKTAKMSVMSGNKCWVQYYTNASPFLTSGPGPYNNVICAVDSNKTRYSDTCQGDSGGPLLMLNGRNTFLLGITSIGRPCGLGSPGIYTYVLSYLDWIQSWILNHRSQSTARFHNYFDNLIGR